LFTND